MATVIMADWILETTGGRLFGVCTIGFSPPYDKFDFTQGFTLPNPTHQRCALQSIITAMEAIRGCAFLKESPCIVLTTKHNALYHLLTDVNYARKWIANNTWPKNQVGNKALIRKAIGMIDELDKSRVTLVYVERDHSDKVFVDLDIGRTADGLDVDRMAAAGSKPEEIERELTDIRMRGVMAEKLLRSGARSFRLPKKKI